MVARVWNAGVKKSLTGTKRASVPKTDTGGRDEYSKALEITIPKELYKIAP